MPKDLSAGLAWGVVGLPKDWSGGLARGGGGEVVPNDWSEGFAGLDGGVAGIADAAGMTITIPQPWHFAFLPASATGRRYLWPQLAHAMSIVTFLFLATSRVDGEITLSSPNEF